MDAFKPLLTVLSVAVALSGCSNRDQHNHPELTTGEQLFIHHCEDCHGVDGTGKLLSSTPANIFTALDVRGIVRYITTETHDGREMPVFANMPKAEANKIARHLQTLKRDYNQTSAKHKKPDGLIINP